MAVKHLGAEATPTQVSAVLAEEGVVIVDELVDPSVMDRAREELRPYMSATGLGPDVFAGFATRRTGGLIARSETCRDLIMHPLVLGSVGELLSHATSFQLHLTQIIAIGPGEKAQQIHRDQWAYDFFRFPPGYEVQCNTIWAMTDFTEDNGATRVAPGSNKFEDGLELDPAQTEPGEMRKGSVLFYTGSLYHGGGANHSSETRCGVNITYNLSWLRQEENQYLSTPLEVARTLPKELLRLMGYARGAYALGYVDDLRDPIEVVRPDLVDDGLGDYERTADKRKAEAERQATAKTE